MTNDGGQQRSRWRRMVGKPPLWQGITWTALGILWFGLAVSSHSAFQWIAGSIWLALGLVTLPVAIHDYRHKEGRYGP